jgi:hypothetical protein
LKTIDPIEVKKEMENIWKNKEESENKDEFKTSDESIPSSYADVYFDI